MVIVDSNQKNVKVPRVYLPIKSKRKKKVREKFNAWSLLKEELACVVSSWNASFNWGKS